MTLARRLTEAPPSLRWHLSRVYGLLLYTRSFAQFGAGSVIVTPLRLRGTERITVGAGCAIYEGSWLEAEIGSALTIGDDVYLGHDVHLHAVDDVTIGSGSMITDGVLVSSGGHDMNNDRQAVRTGPISIGKGCFIGQRAIILGGVTIGDNAVVGAGSVVTRDVAPGQTVAGVPARPTRLYPPETGREDINGGPK